MSLGGSARIEIGVVSETVPAGHLLPGIHALRGIAAVAVVLFHLGHVGQIAVPPLFDFVQADFAKGVYLFFVLSAFSLMHSTARHTTRPRWVTVFFVKRFWRIAPLFYLVLAIVLGWQLLKREPIDPWQVLLNLAFATGFAPSEGLVPAGWTVGVEMLFYALFPLLLLSIRTLRAAVVVAIVSIVVTCTARTVLFRQYGDWANFMLPSNLCFFAFGLLAYFLVHELESERTRTRRLAPIFALVLIFGLFQLDADNWLRQPPGLNTVLWGIGFAALCVWQGAGASHRGNRLLHYLGERSYSIYLLHPLAMRALRGQLHVMYAALLPSGEIVAWIICAAIVLIVLLTCCEATYRLIELPGIQMGARINRRLTSAVHSTFGTP